MAAGLWLCLAGCDNANLEAPTLSWPLRGLGDPYPFTYRGAVDQSGVVWLATSLGVVRLDPRDNTWKTFAGGNGLADDSATSIAQDATGKLWFGTKNGASRLDPVSMDWKTFTTADGLGDNSVGLVAEAGGAIWFAFRSGVTRFNPEQGTWKTFTPADGLAGDVQAIAADSSGAIWFGTTSGVTRFDPGSNDWRTFTTADGLASDSVWALAQDSSGAMWFDTPAGLSRFDPKSNSWRTLWTEGRFDGFRGGPVRLREERPDERDRIRLGVVGSTPDGAFWLATPTGALRIDPTSLEGRSFVRPNLMSWSPTLAEGVFLDTAGSIWLSDSSNNLVLQLEPQTGHWTTFVPSDGLTTNDVRGGAKDATGALWLATSMGAACLDPATGAWKTYLELDGLASNDVRAITADASGRVWLSTARGITRFDRRHDDWRLYTQAHGLPSNDVRSAVLSSTGALWLATAGGAARLDAASDTWLKLTSADGLASNDVRAVAEDATRALWFATSAGVTRYDPASRKVRTFTQADGLPTDYVLGISKEKSGALWFATGRGATRFDPARETWKTLTRADGLSEDYVNSVYEDSSGMLWFATNGGATRFDPRQNTWRTFTVEDGMAWNRVESVFEDAGGGLWFTAERSGATRFDPKEQTWRAFFLRRDLWRNERSVRAVAVDADDGVWFMTPRRMMRFDPAKASWRSFTRTDGLPGGELMSLAADPLGSVWLVTSHGLVHFDPSDESWREVGDAALPSYTYDIAVDAAGTLWLAHSGGVTRFDANSHSSKIFTRGDGLAGNDVRTVAAGREGDLWFATEGGLSHFQPKLAAWNTYAMPNEFHDAPAYALAVDSSGKVWAGSGNGFARFDPEKKAWEVFRNENGSSYYPHSIAADHRGGLWLVERGQVVRRDASGAYQQFRVPDVGEGRAALVALNGGSALLARRTSLEIVEGVRRPRESASSKLIPRLPAGAPASAVAAGPSEGSFWIGTDFGGLTLRGNDRDLVLSPTELPSASVSAISPVAGNGAEAWVGTDGGAVLVSADEAALRVARRVEGLPPGRVDLVQAAGRSRAFFAFNRRDPAIAGSADVRKTTELWEVNGERVLRLLPEAGDRRSFAQSQVRALAWAEHTEHLWIGTSAGMFLRVGDGLRRSIGERSLPTQPIAALAAMLRSDGASQREIVWFGTDGIGDAPTALYGFDPGTGVQSAGTSGTGSINTLAVAGNDLFVVTDNAVGIATIGAGTLSRFVRIPIAALVLVGAGLFVRRAIFRHPLVSNAQQSPDQLRNMAPMELHVTIRHLRRAFALGPLWRRLNLPEESIRAAYVLSNPARHDQRLLTTLVGLLTREGDRPAISKEITPGLWLVAAAVAQPEQLSGHDTAFLALDHDWAQTIDAGRLNEIIRRALVDAQQPKAWPYVLLCKERVLPDWLPEDYVHLEISPATRKDLVLARSARRHFSGLLLARGLCQISPYSEHGHVADQSMFFGREGLLREVLQAESPAYLLVGPRRVGKTSLLQRIERDMLKLGRAVRFIDLLGIEDFHEAVRRIIGDTAGVHDGGFSTPEAAAAALHQHFTGRAQSTPEGTTAPLLLLDEVDGLVKSDIASGFKVLSALRSLQAEGRCSFILAGYSELYRQTMDQSSPLYNFGAVRQLGPLEHEAALTLATQPLERFGIRYESSDIPANIVEQTSAYPSLVQQFCSLLLDALKREWQALPADGRAAHAHADELTIRGAHFELAKGLVEDGLMTLFETNVSKLDQLVVYQLLDRERFIEQDVSITLKSAFGVEVARRDAHRTLSNLRLFGFVESDRSEYRWAIPCLRHCLRKADVAALTRELIDDIGASSAAELDTTSRAL